MREALARDWLDDLRGFGPEIVSIACGDWRRGQTKRPMIADIVGLCSAEQNRRREHDENLRLSGPDQMDTYARGIGWNSNAERVASIMDKRRRDKERYRDLALEGREISNRWARENGYSNWDEAWAAGRKYSEILGSLSGPKTMPKERHTRGGAAADYGVTATEWKPSEEQMTEGRRALGFTDTETA